MNEPPSQPKQVAVLVAVRLLASTRKLWIHPRCIDHIDALDMDAQDVFELIEDCDASELYASEPDDDPAQPRWTAKFRIELEDGRSLYVKVSLALPGLNTGYVLSFKRWSDGI